MGRDINTTFFLSQWELLSPESPFMLQEITVMHFPQKAAFFCISHWRNHKCKEWSWDIITNRLKSRSPHRLSGHWSVPDSGGCFTGMGMSESLYGLRSAFSSSSSDFLLNAFGKRWESCLRLPVLYWNFPSEKKQSFLISALVSSTHPTPAIHSYSCALHNSSALLGHNGFLDVGDFQVFCKNVWNRITLKISFLFSIPDFSVQPSSHYLQSHAVVAGLWLSCTLHANALLRALIRVPRI